jgi:hemoglobin
MKTSPTSTLTDITREADVKTLVDNFCEKVNQDAVLSPAFAAVTRVYWPQHLFTMYNYWCAALFGPKADRSQAAPKDLGLPLEGPHAHRWLQLFGATVQENFAGPKAEEAKRKALSLASVFDKQFPAKSTLSVS